MKKLSVILIAAILAAIALSVTSAAANLGCGVAVVAEDVKLIKTGLSGQKLTFSDTDIKTTLNISSFDKITITSIPKATDGTLLLAGRRVAEGNTVSRRNLAALSFIPSSKAVSEASFKFKVNGFADDNEIICVMKFTDKVNYAPTADGGSDGAISVWTQRDISVFGKMQAKDPEGDALEFMIVGFPSSGSITLLDRSTGEFRYTPSKNYTGEDRFSYVARDEWGNFSRPATVTVKVARRQSEVVYSDMKDSPEYNAAVCMTALGIMSGSTVGDQTLFSPDESVTRAEFVAMALKSKGIRADSTLTETFFDDNDSIPTPLVSYVATAQRLGIVNGHFDGQALNFRPNDAITKCEAAIILSNILGSVEADDALVFADIDSVPVWARESISNMYSIGVFSYTDGYINPSSEVTRKDAATYLYNMLGGK